MRVIIGLFNETKFFTLRLVETIFDRTKRGTSPIWLAALHANSNDFHKLIQQALDNDHSDRLNEIGNTQTGTNPLHIASFKNRIQIVMELIRSTKVWKQKNFLRKY